MLFISDFFALPPRNRQSHFRDVNLIRDQFHRRLALTRMGTGGSICTMTSEWSSLNVIQMQTRAKLNVEYHYPNDPRYFDITN
ncbi:hypothetical protein V6N13_127214 [Hibiscus sabdariffa]|uniref:Uncharacterized protein n=1 Tax=Hibiscus sabdariffa TaxID=183260 RepID=A0ABR2RD58_9ROSI